MDKFLLRKVLEVPTFTTQEIRMVEFITEWCKENGYEYMKDEKNNIFIKKGDITNAPCVVAHMDTVHRDQEILINRDKSLTLIEGNNDYGEIIYAMKHNSDNMLINTGIGGDDKCGIYICLELLKIQENILVAFFVEEETGCHGSRFAKNNDWLKEVGYFIQFDAPYDSWISKSCNGVTLFNETFEDKLKPVWELHGMSEPEHHPYTDVKELRKNYSVCAINYSAGYVNMHTNLEFVVVDFIKNMIILGMDTINTLGCNKYLFDEVKEVTE